MNGHTPPVAAPRVEPAAFAAGFVTALRRAGLPVSVDGAARLASAIQVAPPTQRSVLYWTCRIVLLSSRDQVPAFDAVFSAVFDGRLDPADQRGDPNAPPAIGSEARTRPAPRDDLAARKQEPRDGSETGEPTPAPAGGNADPGAVERETILMLASFERRLHDTSFALLSDEETERVRHLVRRIALSTPLRRSRRVRPTRAEGARLDLRRTVRAAHRTGEEPILLVSSRRREEPRRLILLCDVSASMEPYTRVFLTLLQGAVAGANAEAFVFSTGLTRLTRQLAIRDADAALASAAASTSDWAGGTRLGESIRRFIDEHGRRGLARGAVIVVLSDGWALDDPAVVAAQMARLRRLAHRIVWVNPRTVAPGFQPLVGGMNAALPYVDAIVSGHSYAALGELADLIRAERLDPRSQPGTASDTASDTDHRTRPHPTTRGHDHAA
ncbi:MULTISPECIES: vWA domain-containing protein [unclassified Cryobacterium]|uniref:vWA domain-containing protein n=1 Tax=unclassified Cryobacterium TaxID=2649013 RepID=UPI002AB3A087|nr:MULTISPECIES: VWA domain-containing protein [unclassified Cryobacterium]MDY7543794.1 VWA domain-containing protein [Cryobacterium sp. 5B3]MEA9997600.1 VWA domain-containing protein [Cryobacterium sp. RTS3]MEB0264236.1 VWA domain-containing protein [Cryobacterium sp. 10I5]MEB0275199.1 VWA domain-containing protein [Cryobacterium sp. 5B3]